MTDDWSAALDWAGTTLGSPVVASRALEGGSTSAMLALGHEDGTGTVLRLITEQPWRDHGPALSSREREAQLSLAGTGVPAPTSLGLDASGTSTGVSGHLMSHLPGAPRDDFDDAHLRAMAEVLATIHAHRPETPFRDFETWAWEAKWVVPEWTRHPTSWQRAFEALAEPEPVFEPTFLHRDYGHRNLLWTGDEITGVVDWVETSTGPRWLDAGHAATNLAVVFGVEQAHRFLELYAGLAGEQPQSHWLVMDAVGFLPPPGKKPMFRDPAQLARLDDWLHQLVA